MGHHSVPCLGKVPLVVIIAIWPHIICVSRIRQIKQNDAEGAFESLKSVNCGSPLSFSRLMS